MAASCVRDTKSGDVILKLGYNNTNTVSLRVHLVGVGKIRSASRTVLAGEATGVNTFEHLNPVAPVMEQIPAVRRFYAKSNPIP